VPLAGLASALCNGAAVCCVSGNTTAAAATAPTVLAPANTVRRSNDFFPGFRISNLLSNCRDCDAGRKALCQSFIGR
jgi:hypothetical protein